MPNPLELSVVKICARHAEQKPYHSQDIAKVHYRGCSYIGTTLSNARSGLNFRTTLRTISNARPLIIPTYAEFSIVKNLSVYRRRCHPTIMLVEVLSNPLSHDIYDTFDGRGIWLGPSRLGMSERARRPVSWRNGRARRKRMGGEVRRSDHDRLR